MTRNIVEAFRKFAGDYSVTEVKNFRSRNGTGFMCRLFRGATQVAFVHDAGNGGATFYQWLPKVDKDKEEKLLRTHLESVLSAEEMEFEPEGQWIAALLDHRDTLINMREKAKRGYTVFVSEAMMNNHLHGIPSRVQLCPPEIKVNRAKGCIILNDQLLAD